MVSWYVNNYFTISKCPPLTAPIELDTSVLEQLAITFVSITAMGGVARHEPNLRCILHAYDTSAHARLKQIIMLKSRSNKYWCIGSA